MQKTLRAIQRIYIDKHYDELVAARDRADAVDTADRTLGKRSRLEILAATGAASIKEIIDSAKMVKRLKRGALIQVHNLLYYCNRYGVMICIVPAKHVFAQFDFVEGPCIYFDGGPAILERLGVTSVPSVAYKRERLFDYSTCVETPVDWLPLSKK